MAILLKTASVRVSFIQIMQVRVQNKGKSVWKSRYVGDVSPWRVALTSRAQVKGSKAEPLLLYTDNAVISLLYSLGFFLFMML